MASATGFVGLGIMGRPMATNLARSFPVIGYDVDESRFDGTAGVARAATIAELAAQCAVVCLSLPSAPGRGGGDDWRRRAGGQSESGIARDRSQHESAVCLPPHRGAPGRKGNRVCGRPGERRRGLCKGRGPGDNGGRFTGNVRALVRRFLSVGKSIVRVGEVGAGGVPSWSTT